VPAAQVRPVRPEEYDEVAELTARVYVDGGFSTPDYVPALRAVADRAASTQVLVAVLSDRVVGAVAVATRGGDYAERAGPGEAVMRMLAVAPDARGAGAGETLVRACIAAARAHGCNALRLSTQPDMTAAHRLYGRLGFVRAPGHDWSPAPGVDLRGFVLAL